MPIVYILFSQKLSKFYTGFTTINIADRLNQHLILYYQNKFTAKTNDWEVFLTIKCDSKRQAQSIEKHIKKMKSSMYIRNLQQVPEMIEKLIKKYKDA